MKRFLALCLCLELVLCGNTAAFGAWPAGGPGAAPTGRPGSASAENSGSAPVEAPVAAPEENHEAASEEQPGAEQKTDMNTQYYMLPLENEPGLIFTEVSPITVDLEALCKDYKDVIGWLYSSETVIDYPVVIGKDNQEYLHKTVEGRYDYAGTIFAEYTCARDFSDLNTILHGHHMADGTMFASINSYRSQEYYEAHPVMYLNTPRQNFRVDIFASFITPDFSEPYTHKFLTEEDFQLYLDDMVARSDIQAHVTPDTKHRILTLSTCSYEYDFARYVVQGILVPIG